MHLKVNFNWSNRGMTPNIALQSTAGIIKKRSYSLRLIPESVKCNFGLVITPPKINFVLTIHCGIRFLGTNGNMVGIQLPRTVNQSLLQ